MKRIFIDTLVFLFLMSMTLSCRKKIESDYLNPAITIKGSIGALFTGMLINARIHPTYYNMATLVLPTTAVFSQFVATSPSTLMYVPSMDYIESRWVDFYDGKYNPIQDIDYNYNGSGILSNFREMQTTYAAISPDKQSLQDIFLACGRVVLYDQTAQVIDYWGDIPFSKAGTINTPSRSISYAAFDDAAHLYDSLISGLKELNTYFDTAKMAPESRSSFAKQDILLGGNVASWRKYANSLRLRLLMRISYWNEAKAKAEVMTMLSDPKTYPLITDNANNVTLQESPPNLRSDLLAALRGSPYAPAYMLDTLMVANADPRAVVMFDSARGKAYKGLPYNATAANYDSLDIYSTFDSVTFMYNDNLPGVIFTAAEVSFLTAEANERWAAGNSIAATAYANGIKQSIAFYYSLNQSAILSAGNWKSTPSPTADAIDRYIAHVSYVGSTEQKLNLIATQNWINFFILQPGQAWAELRRTKYPVLKFADAAYAPAKFPPSRLLYPATESIYNSENYVKVSTKDTRDTKIFWDVK